MQEGAVALEVPGLIIAITQRRRPGADQQGVIAVRSHRLLVTLLKDLQVIHLQPAQLGIR